MALRRNSITRHIDLALAFVDLRAVAFPRLRLWGWVLSARKTSEWGAHTHHRYSDFPWRRWIRPATRRAFQTNRASVGVSRFGGTVLGFPRYPGARTYLAG